MSATKFRIDRYRIEAMDCPTEEGLIRSKMEGLAGIHSLEFNLVQRVLTVRHNLVNNQAITTAISGLGMEPVALDAESTQTPQGTKRPKVSSWFPLIVAGLAALGAEGAEWLGMLSPWLPAALALFAVGLSGWKVYLKGWISITNKNLNINALMSIAVTGAAILQLWPESAMVMVLFALAERIEGLSLDRARKAISGLLSLTPPLATVLQPDGTWKSVASDGVAVGASVRVRPGERISHDGQVLRGDSTVDQSPITGESVPVDKATGDPLFAGTVNLHGEL
jgi:Cd2+/Zn2+-exporting ATPase